MTAGQVLVGFIAAIVVGFIVWFVASLVPPFKQYAPQIGLGAFIVVLLVVFVPHLSGSGL